MQIMQAIAGDLQILILQLLFCFGSLHVSQFQACDFFNLCLCSNILQMSGHFCLIQRIVVVAYITTIRCRLLCRYNNCRYYHWAEKLMLHRNWALQIKPTIWYIFIVVYIHTYILILLHFICRRLKETMMGRGHPTAK